MAGAHNDDVRIAILELAYVYAFYASRNLCLLSRLLLRYPTCMQMKWWLGHWERKLYCIKMHKGTSLTVSLLETNIWVRNHCILEEAVCYVK